MKSDREFINGIYQKAAAYQKDAEKISFFKRHFHTSGYRLAFSGAFTFAAVALISIVAKTTFFRQDQPGLEKRRVNEEEISNETKLTELNQIQKTSELLKQYDMVVTGKSLKLEFGEDGCEMLFQSAHTYLGETKEAIRVYLKPGEEELVQAQTGEDGILLFLKASVSKNTETAKERAEQSMPADDDTESPGEMVCYETGEDGIYILKESKEPQIYTSANGNLIDLQDIIEGLNY